MKILVTGGAGFVGSHVAEYYADNGHQVVVLDNLSRQDLLGKESIDSNWNYLEENYEIDMIKGDVRDTDTVSEAIENCDAVIHTAGQTAVTSSLEDPTTDFLVNAQGTLNVLENANNEGADVVYCSTNKVYGDNINSIDLEERKTRYEFSNIAGVDESTSIDLCEHTPYGCSKLAGDLYAQDYGKRTDIRTGVFRMSCIYGVRQHGIEDQGWVAWFTRAFLENKKLTIYGDGKQVRDVLYISDLVKAFDSFITGEVSSDVFNIGGGPENTLSLLELMDLLESKTGETTEIEYSEWRPSDQKVYVSDTKKAQNILDWNSKIDPETGLNRLIDWMRSEKID